MRLALSTRLSSATISPRSGSSGRASAVAFSDVADRQPSGEALGNAEVDQDARAVVDGREFGRGRNLGARLHRQEADDPADRRADRAPLERQARVAHLELGGPRRQPRLAHRHVGGGAARLQLLEPLERRLGLGDVELGAGEGDHLRLVVEPRDDVARGHDRRPT